MKSFFLCQPQQAVCPYLVYEPDTQVMTWYEPVPPGTEHGPISLSAFQAIDPTDVGQIDVDNPGDPITSIGCFDPYTNLRFLYISDQQLSVLDISDHPSLYSVEMYGTPLTQFNCARMPSLRFLTVGNDTGPGYTLDCTDCTALEKAYPADGSLLSANFTGCSALLDVRMQTAELLTELTIPDSPLLYYLALDRCNGLTSVDFTSTSENPLPSLTTFYMRHCTGLQTVQLSGLVNLETVLLEDDSALASIDCSGCSSLDILQFPQCPILTSVDLTGCVGLTEVSGGGNAALTTIDVSDSPMLSMVVLSGTALTEATVNAIAIFLDGAGLSGGTFWTQGGTSSPPTGAGATAIGNLIAKSWSILHN